MSCPICQKDPNQKFRPFCSKRCADIDLGKWLTGKYAIAMENSDEDEATEESQQKPH
ncbi:hypothetical protein MNBD_ALPHA07-2028 [hydrothermal vent metagenome]|uniref:DNA gyrase inhibitor YacG n=1 Tax=hydrothermal vent metagenome TaxID=652676 RepID=A0A3B0S2W3_9ZZZZ